MRSLYRSFFKRIFDCFVASILLVLLSPILFFIAILVRVKLGSPILFKQKRPGLHEKIFCMVKFRTMTDERDENGDYLSDRVRLTKFGKLLRSTSLDELPELLNVVKGEMSLVGPRPLLVQYLPLYNKRQKRRHDVRPGITGLAQVGGRNAIDWQQKFELDVQYVEKLSFLGDIKILLMTVKKVIFREGIHAENSSTMEPFEGNESED